VTERNERTPVAHLATFYDNAAEYTSQVAGFVRDGVAAGQQALVAVPMPQLGWLRDELGTRDASIRFGDMAEVGRNPAWIIPYVQDFLDGHTGKYVRFVSEPIWDSRSAAEVREATRHEALINLAFAGAAVSILCPYDTSSLSPAVIADARRTHPLLMTPGSVTPSPAYGGPGDIPASCLAPLTSSAGAIACTYTRDLHAVRELVERAAAAARLPAAKTADLVLAVSEVAANTLRHTHSPGTLEIKRHEHEIVCTLHDSGIIADPLAGLRRPPLNASHGHGLWLTHQLCDLVETRSGAPGTLTRLHMRIPAR
jgi:anti-sigma regulatory factor (Ser/Thr protein kinase)